MDFEVKREEDKLILIVNGHVSSRPLYLMKDWLFSLYSSGRDVVIMDKNRVVAVATGPNSCALVYEIFFFLCSKQVTFNAVPAKILKTKIVENQSKRGVVFFDTVFKESDTGVLYRSKCDEFVLLTHIILTADLPIYRIEQMSIFDRKK